MANNKQSTSSNKKSVDEPEISSTHTDKQVVETHQSLPASANNSTRNLLLAILGLAVLAVVFMAGMAVARQQRRNGFAAAPFVGFSRRGGFVGRRFDNRLDENATIINGKVTSVNGNDFSLDQNGSTKTIKTNSSTHFMGIGISGLKSGDQVTVAGTTNSDGSVQAIKVNVQPS